MSKTPKSQLRKYSISIVVAALLGWTYLAQYELSTLSQTALYKALCDAFTIPGMLFILSGLLMAVANKGALDGIGYLLSYAGKMFVPLARLFGYNKEAREENYGDSVERQREKRVKGYGFLFVVGGVCMAVSCVFLVLFYSVFQG